MADQPDPLADVVSAQYEKWVYPEPIQDLPAWLVGNWQWFDPSHAHRLFWPDREYKADLEILVAGCGTNQAAVFAYTNPGARVTAIDVSAASLGHHRVLKERYGLHNLDLHRLPIEEVGSLGRDYDLVVSTGVLHHLEDPAVGLQALARCLRPEGVAALMLYARYGRIGVEMLQGVFRDLGLTQDVPSLGVVKATIAALPQDHPLRSYMAVAPDLEFDAGLVDTFLHGRDRSYTVADCLDLVAAGGLVFQDWFLKSSYVPATSPDDPFLAAVAALPPAEQWAVMERIHHRNGCHFFTACHSRRPVDRYRIDTESDRWFDAVPLFRYRCGLDGAQIHRPGWRTPLTSEQVALVRLIDGHRTIREIVAASADAEALKDRSRSELEAFARDVFRSLWQRDFLALAVAPRGRGTPEAPAPAIRQRIVADRGQATTTLVQPDAASQNLRPALRRRWLGRGVAQGEIRLPAVPAMLDESLEVCVRTFGALGVEFSTEQRERLRQALAGQAAIAWQSSPRSEILVTYDKPVGLTVNYLVKPLWAALDAAYDAWVATRQPPYFGTHPDARVWSLAADTTPSACPVLDVGAGTGRNALALARRGHPVDAVEPSGKFAEILGGEAAKESLPVRIIQRDVFATRDDLRRDYGLIVVSEVVSDFRSPGQLRGVFELAADRLAPGGRLVMNVFVPRDGYEPDAAARELGQQTYTSIFTRGELAAAAAGLPLDLVADDSVYDYERLNLPEGAWPPTGWYADWASGRDVFDVPREESPIELRWLVYAKRPAAT